MAHLSRGQRRWVYAAAAAVWLSGLLWLVFHHFIQVEGQFGEMPHPLERWWLELHGGAAMLVLVVVGSLLPVHMRRAWHQRKNIVAGLSLATVALLLTISGYGFYYFGGEQLRPVISAFHWVVGLAAPGVLAWHITPKSAARSAAGRRSASDETLRPTETPLAQAHESQGKGPSASA